MPTHESRHQRRDGSGMTGRPAEGEGAEPPEDESVDRPLAGLAHNMRNLLQVVNGNLELIAARTDDDLTLRYLKNAQTAARLITELVQDFDEQLPE